MQLPVPDAVLFRHVPGGHSKSLTPSSDGVARLSRPGESLSGHDGQRLPASRYDGWTRSVMRSELEGQEQAKDTGREA
jgi:hypothetical protein